MKSSFVKGGCNRINVSSAQASSIDERFSVLVVFALLELLLVGAVLFAYTSTAVALLQLTSVKLVLFGVFLWQGLCAVGYLAMPKTIGASKYSEWIVFVLIFAIPLFLAGPYCIHESELLKFTINQAG